MSYSNLKEFIGVLRAEHEVADIHAQVDPYLEIAEIHRRVIAENGPALFFHNVKGSQFPVVTNLFGTKKRVELAFGAYPQKFIKDLVTIAQDSFPPSLSCLWQKRSTLAGFRHIGVSRCSYQKSPVCETSLSPARLTEVPLLTTWIDDGGAFITLPLVYTEDPKSGIPNLGMYRMQRFDDEHIGLHMQIGKGGGFHLAQAAQLGKTLPVSAHVGGPPALILSAIAPLPENVPELLLASLVNRRKIRLAKVPGHPIPILADSEFAVVGQCDPKQLRGEGPFGDHYGYYSLLHDFPFIKAQTIYHRKDAIYPATVVGKPRQEDFYIGNYLQELLSPLFPLVMPAVEDLWSYAETGFHSLAAVRVKQRYKREAMASAFRILGEGQLSLTKFLLVLDRPYDLRDFRSVLEAVLERTDFQSDLYIFANLSMDTLDYTGPKLNEGSKGILLGVGEPKRVLPRALPSELPAPLDKMQVFCPGCLVVSGSSYAQDQKLAQKVAQMSALSDWPLIVLVDDALSTTRSEEAFLWTVFTRFEPARDIFASSTAYPRYHPSFCPPIVIDSRMKPEYPGEVICDPDTEKLVNDRWRSYGI